MKKKISAIVTAAVIALSATACGKSETKDEKVVRIAYLPITHSLAVLEEADELEAKEGIKVELVKYGSWIKAVALGHHDGNVIVVKNDIESAEDLKGKNIAIPHRQSSHNILINDALAKAGLTVKDVNITELAPTEMPSALASGQIDAYCVAEPFGAMGVSIGAGKVLYRSDELWEDSICCGLVLTDKFINDRPEDAKNFVDSYKAAGAELTKEKAKETAKKYLSQSDEVLDMSLEWISYDDLDITEEAYDALVEKVKSYGLSEEPPAYSDFVKNDL